MTARLWRRWANHRQLRKLLRPAPNRAVIVGTFPNEPIARLAAGRLADEGIEAFVFQEEIGVGAIPVPAPVHVMVHPQDETTARELLA